eukprot:scaffold4360_cov199-Amphora_coffeaeformis.AAC.1
MNLPSQSRNFDMESQKPNERMSPSIATVEPRREEIGLSVMSLLFSRTAVFGGVSSRPAKKERGVSLLCCRQTMEGNRGHHSNDPPINNTDNYASTSMRQSDTSDGVTGVLDSDPASGEKKRKRQEIDEPNQEKPQQPPQRSLPGTMPLPNSDDHQSTFPKSLKASTMNHTFSECAQGVGSSWNITLTNTPTIFTVNAELGQGTHQQMLAPLTAATTARREPQFGSLQQQQHMQPQMPQQGFNIFGLTPMQLQQMLLMQTQISQLQGNFNNNQIADQ